MRESEKPPKEFLLPIVEQMRTSEHLVAAGENSEGYTVPQGIEKIKSGQDEGEKIVKVDGVKRSSATMARTLRKKFTDAEQKLWKHLRGRQIGGEKFRRQQPLGKYVVDFVCLEKKLIVKVDGGQHAASEYDKERTLWLESEGFRVIRFWNNEVPGDIGIVLDVIYREMKSDEICHPHPGPVSVSAAFERYCMRAGAVGDGCPDAHLLASVPSRERGEISGESRDGVRMLTRSHSLIKGEERSREARGREVNQNA